MNFLRKLLFPLSVLYGWIVCFRNFLYDKGFLKSYSFDIPIIAVGNLSVGGTGKTPQIEYLIRLLSNQYKIATLSRGYKRHSKGFIVADTSSNAKLLGDEPFQFYQKFKNIQVAVDADRKNGIEQLLLQNIKPEIILLDDAFQHRRVKAGFYILLTAYNDLYCNDFILPTGNLRESRSGAARANIIIVTKCPENISELEQHVIEAKLSAKVPVYFTTIAYDEHVYSATETIKVSDLKSESILLIAGIAKPEPFFSYLSNEKEDKLIFPDHHHFSNEDIITINKKAYGRKIITTEKDYVRLKDNFKSNQLYCLPIKTAFITNNINFDNTILDYVGKSSRNR